MATYQQNTLSGFHPVTNALFGISRAIADPAYEIAGQKARQDADYNTARIGETTANTRKLDAATALDRQKFTGRAGLGDAISGAFDESGQLRPEAQAAILSTLAQGDQLGNARDVFSIGSAFSLNPGDAGYDDELRRSLVMGGHMPDQNFAGTAGRADAVSVRDAAEAYQQAVTVQGMQDRTSITNNTLDNETSILNNGADNTRAIAIADADRIAKTADGQKPLYQAFQDADGNVFTFDTHAAHPTFEPAQGVSGITKIGTPGRGAAAKTYSLSPTQLDDFLGAVPQIGAALGYGEVSEEVQQIVADRAAEIYGAGGNSQTAITQAYQELVEKGEASGWFGTGDPIARLRAAQLDAAPAAGGDAQQLITDAQAAIAAGADPVAVKAEFERMTGQELQ